MLAAIVGARMFYVLKRILLIVVGYLAAAPVGLISILIVYLILSSLPGAPSYFEAMAMSPLVILAVPPVALFVLFIAVILTCLPALAAAIVSEIFSLRQVWLHGLLGGAIGAGTFVYASPELVGTIEGTDWADLAIVAVGGLAGGITYWLIAGRRAGLIRPALSPLPG
jgi:hypothetical protein